MAKYLCIKPLILKARDINGFPLDAERTVLIKAGESFSVKSDCLFAQDKEAVRLEGEMYWVEIHPDTLEKHFKEVK